VAPLKLGEELTMAVTPSTMLPLGTQAPFFSLQDGKGETFSLDAFRKSRALLLMFICNHCPFVKHIQSGLVSLAKDYQTQGVAILAINANDAEKYPDDSPQKMVEESEKLGYPFPYLIDETQAIAKAYHAACTPDFFLFDPHQKLVYRGQMDGARPGNTIPVTGIDLRQAMDALLSEKPLSQDQKPSMGCNIKWKPANAPHYFHV
jgi:peroxiredoxin